MLNDGISEYFSNRLEEFRASEGQEQFLSDLAERFGFSNLTYFFLGSRIVNGSPGKLITTYAREWQDHYFTMNYDEIDPIVLFGMKAFLPLDWSLIPKVKKTARRFFGEAMEFGISDLGVTIPVRGANAETALVSLNTDMSSQDWALFLKEHVADVTYFASLLHREVLRPITNASGVTSVELSMREREVLQWAAAGKSSWETSTILGLSSRTVEHYLGNAASKLDAATKAQAVAKAIAQGHIHLCNIDK